VTGNEHRDRDLYKAMDADRYPMVRFDLTSITPGGVVQGDSVDATLHGTFTARGVTHDVDVPVAIAFGPESIAVRGQFPLDLKDYRIHGLSRMLGLLKVDEHIVVHVALGFRPSDTIHASATAGDPGTSGGHARRSPPNAVADSSQ
jgi:polyisoprenoid-binding protein YceI